MKRFQSAIPPLLFLAAACALSARAGVTSSWRSGQVGTVDYLDGRITLDGKPLAYAPDKLSVLSPGIPLASGSGHAEVLLTPGVFLRTGAESEAVLENDSLSDTRVRLLRGGAVLEVDQLHRDNLLRIDVGPHTVRILKTGLYRLDTSPFLLTVIKGKAEVTGSGETRRAGSHRRMTYDGRYVVSRVHAQDSDDLSHWSRLRSEYEAEASVSSAQYMFDMGWGWNGYGWFWNPWFSTYSWFPAGGWYLNPYGFSLWSPLSVYDYYPFRFYGQRGLHYAPRLGARTSGLNRQRGFGRAPVAGGRGFAAPRSRFFSSPAYGSRGFSPRAFPGGGLSGRSFGGGLRGRR